SKPVSGSSRRSPASSANLLRRSRPITADANSSNGASRFGIRLTEPANNRINCTFGPKPPPEGGARLRLSLPRWPPSGGPMKDRLWQAVYNTLRPLLNDADVVMAPTGDRPGFPCAAILLRRFDRPQELHDSRTA